MVRVINIVAATAMLAVSAGVALASAEKASATVTQPASIEAAAPAPAKVSPVADASSCIRKVKVVYAGYGEANRACTVAAEAPAR